MGVNRKTAKIESTLGSEIFSDKELGEAFDKWCQENEGLLGLFESQPEALKGLMFAISEFHASRAWLLFEEAREFASLLGKRGDEIEASIPQMLMLAKFDSVLENKDAILAFSKRQQALALGRQLGVLKRQNKGKERRDKLTEAIAHLFDKPDKPGWRQTNEQITDFLVPRFPAYKRSTISRHVNSVAAKYREAGKS